MKSGLQMAGRMISYYLVAMVVSMLFLLMMGEQLWLQILLNALLLASYAALLYNDGGSCGEKAATLSVTVQRQREEGRAIDPKQQSGCFRKKTALIGYLFGVLPLLLIAAANLIAEPFYPAFEPARIEAEGLAYIDGIAGEIADGMPVERAEEAGEAPAGAPLETQTPLEPQDAQPEDAEPGDTKPENAEPQPSVPVNWFNVVARLAFSPYIAFYTLLESRPHILNLLFLLFALLLPAAEPLGYLRGPKLRQKKLEMIEKGKKRKMRNLRVNKKPKQGPKPPKMEV